jgi:hypothetical protein
MNKSVLLKEYSLYSCIQTEKTKKLQGTTHSSKQWLTGILVGLITAGSSF